MPHVPLESTIAVQTHGRYLLRAHPSASVIAGFHGYGESAEDQLPRIAGIPGSDEWNLVSIQGLHRFYERRSDRVVASWMTRQDREFAIADNIDYVAGVINQVLGNRPVDRFVCAGFSQGVAMAFRAAVASTAAHRYVIAVGGDVPPELTSGALAGLSSVLMCRGAADQWYGQQTLERDVQRLEAAGVQVEAVVVNSGHEWSEQITGAVDRFLQRTGAGAREAR